MSNEAGFTDVKVYWDETPMGEMIERVARSIAAADGYDTWQDAHENTVRHYTRMARAAIEAIEIAGWSRPL